MLCSVDLSRAMIGDNALVPHIVAHTTWCTRAVTEPLWQAALGRWCPNLTDVDLSWCVNIGDQGVIALAHGCRGLKKFEYKGCRRLTPDSIAEVRRGSAEG